MSPARVREEAGLQPCEQISEEAVDKIRGRCWRISGAAHRTFRNREIQRFSTGFAGLQSSAVRGADADTNRLALPQ